METGKYNDNIFEEAPLLYPINGDFAMDFFTKEFVCRNKGIKCIDVVCTILHNKTNMKYCFITHNYIKPIVRGDAYDAEYLDLIYKSFIEFGNHLNEYKNIKDIRIYSKGEIEDILKKRYKIYRNQGRYLDNPHS